MAEPLLPPASDLTSEACAWIAQLETGRMSGEDLAALREWIKRSPRHLAEIKRVARIAGQSNVIAEMAGPLQSATESLRPIVRPRPALLRPHWQMVIAAMMLLLAIGAGVMVMTDGTFTKTYVVTTPVGAMKEARLSDGSVVKLNTDSEVEVDFDRKQRRVRLLKGEAFFEVAHNPNRPFIVYAGDKYVRAVGTAFAVRWTDNALLVTVSEGRVEFDKMPTAGARTASKRGEAPPVPEQTGPHPVLVTAGHRLIMTPNADKRVVEAVSQRALVRDLSWRVGFLDFAGMPLSDVVREWARYTDLKFEIADSDLGAMKFDGIFRATEIGAFFDALEHSFGVDVEYVGDKTIRLKRASASKPG